MSGLGSLLLLGLIGWFLWRRRPGSAAGIEDVLSDAERAGIITSEQRRAILERGASAAPGASSVQLSGVTWLAILAGLFVLAGISLLIATNWEHIGPVVRILAFLVLLLAVGEGAVRARSTGLAITLELIWLVLPLLGIGLYAQTFQLSGETITPFLVWLALGAPLAWRTRHDVVPALHTGALFVVVLVGTFLADGPMLLRGPAGFGAWALSIGSLALAVVQSLRLLPPGQRYHSFGIVGAWVLGVLIATPAFGLEDGAWIAIACVALTTLWIVALLHLEASSSELLTAGVTWLGILYAVTFAWHTDGALEGDASTSAIVVVLLLALGAFAGIVGVSSSRFGAHARSVRGLFAAPLALMFVLLLGDEGVFAAAVLANVVLVAIAVAFMWHGSTQRDAGEVNFGILILLLVLVTRFIDVFGTFVQSGLGFIVAGLLLAALAYALERTRRRLLSGEGEAAR